MKTASIVLAAMVAGGPAFAATQELDQGGATMRDQQLQQSQQEPVPSYDTGEQVESGRLQGSGVIVDDDQTAELPAQEDSLAPGADQSGAQNNSIEDEEYGSPGDDEHAPSGSEDTIRQ